MPDYMNNIFGEEADVIERDPAQMTEQELEDQAVNAQPYVAPAAPSEPAKPFVPDEATQKEIRENWANFQPTDSFQPDDKPFDWLKEEFPTLAGVIDKYRAEGVSDEHLADLFNEEALSMLFDEKLTPAELDERFGRTDESKRRTDYMLTEKKIGAVAALKDMTTEDVAVRVNDARIMGLDPWMFLSNEALYQRLTGGGITRYYNNFIDAFLSSFMARQEDDQTARASMPYILDSAIGIDTPEQLAQYRTYLESLNLEQMRRQNLRSSNPLQWIVSSFGSLTSQMWSGMNEGSKWAPAYIAASAALGLALSGGAAAPLMLGALGLGAAGAAATTGQLLAASWGAGVASTASGVAASTLGPLAANWALGEAAAMTHGMFTDTFYLETASEFPTLLEKGADSRTAARLAVVGGGIKAAIELDMMSKMTKYIPGFKIHSPFENIKLPASVSEKLKGLIWKEGTAPLFNVPTVSSAIMHGALEYAQTMKDEILEEGMQDAVDIVTEAITPWLMGQQNPVQALDQIFSLKSGKRLIGTMWEAAKEFAPGMLPGALFLRIGPAALGARAESRTPQNRMKAAANARWEAMRKGETTAEQKAADVVFIPQNVLQTYNQSAVETAANENAEPLTVDQELGIEEAPAAEQQKKTVEEQLGITPEDVVESTGEVMIPREKYEALAKEDPAFAKATEDHVREGADRMTKAELAGALKKIRNNTADPLNADNDFAKSAREVREQVKQELIASGRDEVEAEYGSYIWAKRLLVRSLQLGSDKLGITRKGALLPADLHKLRVKGYGSNVRGVQAIADTNSGVFNQELLLPGDYDEQGNVRPEAIEEIVSELNAIRTEAQANGTYLMADNGQKSNLPAGVWEMVRTRWFKAWFGNSQVVDSNGEPLVVYHGTTDAGFTSFNTEGHGKTTGAGAFFSDKKEIAATYADDSTDMVAPVYDENGNLVMDEYEDDRIQLENYYKDTYPVFLRIEHPYIVDAQGKNWDRVGEISIYNNETDEYIYADEDGRPFMSEDGAWDYIEKNLNDPEHETHDVSVAGEMTTDEIARAVYNGSYGKDWGDGIETPYDGVIFANVMDEGPAGHGWSRESTVYTVPTPEQIKSVNNRGTFDAGENIFYQQQAERRYKGKLHQDSIAWAKAVDKYLIGEMGNHDIVRVMDMPLALELAGAPVREIVADKTFFDHTISGKHSGEVKPALMKKLVRSLADPIMVFDSASHPGTSLVAMLELQDEQGATIVVPVRLQMNPNDPNTPAKIASFYGKGDPKTGVPNDKWFIKQVVDKKGNLTGRLKYVNTKKLSRWSSAGGLQLPRVLAPSRLPSSISTEVDLVKYRKMNGNLFYQSAAPSNTLVATHGIDVSALEKALANFDGRLPMPSLAIGKRGQEGATHYGQVTLIGDRNLVDPQLDRTTDVYDTDMWSPTVPRPEYKLNQARRKAMREVVNSAFTKWSDYKTDSYEINYLLGAEDTTLDRLISSAAQKVPFKAEYISQVLGETPAIVRDENGQLDDAASRSALLDQFRRLVGYDSSEYNKWVENQFRPLAGEALVKVGRKMMPYTAENVLEAMRKKGKLASQDTMFYGPGKVRAKGAKKLTSVKAMHSAEGQLASKQDFEKWKNEVGDPAFEDAHSKLSAEMTRAEKAKGYEPNPFDMLDEAARALASFISGKKSLESVTGISDLSEETKAAAQKYKDVIAQAKTEYFEAKPRRLVSLSEFRAAVVPASTPAELRQKLEEQGLKVYEYPDDDEAARQQITEQAAQEQNVFFQIIGEQGASRLSNAAQVRADLSVAREMEEAGKDAKGIRLATGWERGADGKWRYEIQDGELDTEKLLEKPEGQEREKLLANTNGTVQPRAEEKSEAPQNAEPRRARIEAKNIQEVRDALRPLKGQIFTNRATGIQATFGSDQIEKMVCAKARRKTEANGFTYRDHFTAAANVVSLFEDAQLNEVHGDKNGSPDILSIKRFIAPFESSQGPATVKLTVKEIRREGHRIYSVEVLEIEKPETGTLGQFNTNAEPTPAVPDNVSVSQTSAQNKSELSQVRTDDVADDSLPFLQETNEQQARGQIEIGPNGEGIITLFENADRSTFLHEMGHMFLDDLISDGLSGLSERSRADLETVKKYLGIEDLDLSRRHVFTGEERARYAEAQERFARSWESYLMEGIAPTPELRGVFARIKQWLIDIYRDVTSLDVELSDEVREVFDHLLMTEDEIEAANTTVEQLAAVNDMTDSRISELEKEIAAIPRVISAQWDSAGLDDENAPDWVTRELMDGAGDALAEGRPALVKAIRKLGGIRYDSVVATWGEGEAKELRARDRSLFRKDGAAFDTLVAELEHEGIHVEDAQDLYNRLMADEPKITKGLNVAITEETLPWLFYLMDDSEVRDYASRRMRQLKKELRALQEADDHTELRTRGPEIAKEQSLIREVLATIKNPKKRKTAVSEASDAAFIGMDVDLSFGPAQAEARHESIPTQEAADRAAGLLSDDELISLKEADRRAWRRAQRESRRAFFAGKQEGIAQAKAKLAAMKEAQRKRKAEREEINKAVKFMKKALVDKQISWTMQQKIKAKLEEYTLSRPNKNRLATAQAILDYIEQTPDAELSQFHPSDQRYVRMLETTTLNDMTLADVRALRQEIEDMVLEGREQFDRWRFEREHRRKVGHDALMDALGEGYVPDSEMKTIVGPADLGKQYKGVKGKLAKVKDWTFANTLGANRFFDWLGGGKGDYKSSWTHYFVDMVNEALDTELKNSQARFEQMEALMASLNITFDSLNELRNVDGQMYSVDQLIHIYAGLKNEASRKAITYGNMKRRLMQDGESAVQEHIAHCVQALTDAERQLGDAVIADFNVHFERINNALIDAFNQGMKHEENYTPMARLEYSAQSLNNIFDIDENKMIEGEVQTKGALNAALEKGFLEERMEIDDEHQQPIKLGLISMWHDQVQVQEHTAAYGKIAGDLRSMLMQRDDSGVTIGRRIVDTFGREALANLREYTNIAIQGQNITASGVLNDWYSYLGRNMAIAYLTLNFGTVMKQVTSLPRFLITAGPAFISKSTGEFLTNVFSKEHGEGFLNKIYELDPQMRNRAPDAFLRVLKDARQYGKADSAYMKALEKMMAPISYMDRVVSSIGWWATYQSNLKKGLSKAEAVREAQRAVALTQQTPLAKDMPRVWNQSGLARLMMIFTSDNANTWGMSVYDLTHTPKGKQRLATVAALASTALLMGYATGGPDDDDEAWIAWYMRQFLNQQLGATPVIGKEVMSAIDAMSSRGFGQSNYSALTAPFVKLMKGGSGIFAEDADKMYDDGSTKRERSLFTALEGISLLAPFPFTTLNRIRRIIRSEDAGDAAKILFGMRLGRRK